MNPRNLSAEALLAQCRWETFRGPGPGGQKRNKTSSSVRIVHTPTGITATAGEFRSQERNKANALRRLRHRMAIELREPIDTNSRLPDELKSFFPHDRLDCSLRDDAYPALLGFVLDIIYFHAGVVSLSADHLGVSTANLMRFLQKDKEALAMVNRLRGAHQLRPLGGRA